MIKKKENLYKELYSAYFISLIPLVLFGFYKNGIQPYQKGRIDFLNMWKPLIIIVMGILGALIGGLLREHHGEKKVDQKAFEACLGNVLEAALVVAILPLKSSPIIVFIVTFFVSLFLNKLKVNRIAVLYIAIEGFNVLFGLNNFFNAYEESVILHYDALDIFLGFGPGGIFATCTLFVFIALLFLSFNKLYKKEMSIAGILTFLVLGIVPKMIIGDYNSIFPYIFGYNTLFILVFVASNLYSSSYTVPGQILSGILIGILTFGLSFITPYTAAICAILIVSLLSGVLDRIFVIK